ncbi:hypothetical protein V8F33_005577 [Rhypophila sp. PSN 637]
MAWDSSRFKALKFDITAYMLALCLDLLNGWIGMALTTCKSQRPSAPSCSTRPAKRPMPTSEGSRQTLGHPYKMNNRMERTGKKRK